MSSTTDKKKSELKVIYCAVCKKWLTGYYSYRHVRSQLHKTQLLRYQNKVDSITSAVVKPTTVPATSTSTEVETTPEKTYSHFRVEGDTLKKCPHEHSSLYQNCNYFESNDSHDKEDRDDRWHVKQKIFEQEERQQQENAAWPQAFDENWGFQETYNQTQSSTNQCDGATGQFQLIGQITTEISAQTTSNDAGLPVTTVTSERVDCGLYHASEIDFLACETCSCAFPSYQDYSVQFPDVFPCGVFHDNQIGYYACGICNSDQGTLEEYKQYLN